MISRLPRVPLRRWAARIIGPAKGRVLRGAIAMSVTAALAGGLGFAWHAMSRSPTFAIDDIQVTGLTRSTEDEIRTLAGVEMGDNSVALDTNELAHAIEKHPWVRKANVLRRLPRGLTLEITEHQPIALVALEHLYYVDADGEVIKRLTPGESEILPVVTGLSKDDVAESDQLALSQIRAALSFIEAWSRAKPNSTVEEVHVGPSGTIAVALSADGVRVHLGPAPWDDAIARYDEIVADAAERGVVPAEIAAYSARRPDRAVVRIASAVAAAPSNKSQKKK